MMERIVTVLALRKMCGFGVVVVTSEAHCYTEGAHYYLYDYG